MPTAPAPGHRARSRSPTASTCGRTSPRPSRRASPPTAPARPSPPSPRPGTTPRRRRRPRRTPAGKFAERARAKHELVHRLRAEGRGLREIARHLGWGLHTVQRYDRAATWQELAESRWPTERPSKLDPFKPYLDQHAGGGHGSFTRLFHEVKAPRLRRQLRRRPQLPRPHPPGQGTAARGPADRPGPSRTGSADAPAT